MESLHRCTVVLASFALIALAGCLPSGPDSVRDAETVNAAASAPIKVSSKASVFLVEMVDARLMDFEEGKLASERGTQSTVRDYGRLMMRDQTLLLDQLNRLAAKSGVAVPVTISAAKRDGLSDLVKTTPDHFDKAFVRSIRIDHERDVGEFRKATAFDDADVAQFAVERLPLIESHLEGAKQIAASQ